MLRLKDFPCNTMKVAEVVKVDNKYFLRHVYEKEVDFDEVSFMKNQLLAEKALAWTLEQTPVVVDAIEGINLDLTNITE